MAWQIIALAALAAFLGAVINTVGAGGAILVYLGLTVVCGLPAPTAFATSHLSTPAAFLVARLTRRAADRAPLTWSGGALPAAAGGLAGSLVLPLIPNQVTAAAPPLVLLAALALLVSPLLAQLGRWRTWPALIYPLAALTGLYAGIFGLSVGAIALAVVLVTHATPLAAANMIKNDWCLTISVTAAGGYLLTAVSHPALVAWPLVPGMIIAAGLGGWIGEQCALRLPEPVRWATIAGTVTVGGLYTLIAS